MIKETLKSIVMLAVFVAIIVGGIFIKRSLPETPEKICVEELQVIGVETQVVPSIGYDDKYYHYQFSNGDKEIYSYKAYLVGEKFCNKYQ